MDTETTGLGPARPTRVEVTYECDGRMWRVALDPTHLPLFFFDMQRRNQIWGEHARAVILRTEEDWAHFERCHRTRVLLEGPYEVDEPEGSATCFCFEDDMGTRYCVCGIR